MSQGGSQCVHESVACSGSYSGCHDEAAPTDSHGYICILPDMCNLPAGTLSEGVNCDSVEGGCALSVLVAAATLTCDVGYGGTPSIAGAACPSDQATFTGATFCTGPPPSHHFISFPPCHTFLCKPMSVSPFLGRSLRRRIRAHHTRVLWLPLSSSATACVPSNCYFEVHSGPG